MAYSESTYKGDEKHKINATGDVVVGDKVAFERAKFSGSFRNPKFEGHEKVEGHVVKDSYGKDKQQHTFTLQHENGETSRIKGRNLYKNGVYRQPWDDESQRKKVADEKHARGDAARAARQERKEHEMPYWK
jgi:hypothetical protein